MKDLYDITRHLVWLTQFGLLPPRLRTAGTIGSRFCLAAKGFCARGMDRSGWRDSGDTGRGEQLALFPEGHRTAGAYP